LSLQRPLKYGELAGRMNKKKSAAARKIVGMAADEETGILPQDE
jgi:hypothetical protein